MADAAARALGTARGRGIRCRLRPGSGVAVGADGPEDIRTVVRAAPAPSEIGADDAHPSRRAAKEVPP
jgi:hypothetical protein